MKAYILCFCVTILCTFIAQKCFKINKRKSIILAIVMSAIAIFIPCFIAGVRDEDVGRDIHAYVIPVMNKAINATSISSYISATSYVEIGYSLFIYLITRFSENLSVVLFFTQLIPCLCVYIFAYKNRDKLSMPLMMAVYLFVWYLRSYTIMRQSIAVGIILIAVCMLNEKKYFRCVIAFIIALLFHSSAIVALPMLVLFYIMDSKKLSKKYKIILCLICMLILLILVFVYEPILKILSEDLGIIPIKYYNYLNNSNYYKDDLIISWSEIISRIVYLVIGAIFIIINMKKKDKKDNNYIKYFLLLVFEAILFILNFNIANASRIGYYYKYIGMLYCLTAFPNVFKKDCINKILVSLVICIIMFVFWFWKYPIQKDCETYPYTSSEVTWLN